MYVVDKHTTSSGESSATVARRIEGRFGLVPNFFRLTEEIPEMTERLFAFAEAAYLNNPLPSVFKERLFVQLSRFCVVRYCIARHIGFLIGLGQPAGDAKATPQSVDDVVRLLQRSLPTGRELDGRISLCDACVSPIEEFPAPDSELEQAIFALASHVFLVTEDALRSMEALKRLFGPVLSQFLFVFLTFVRAAHYWTKIHPELEFEEDLNELLRAHEALAACILKDPEAGQDPLFSDR